MKLQSSYDSQDKIPEAFRPLYTERDGKFELTEVEGLRTQGDFDRFETALRKRLADATQKLEGSGGVAGLDREGLRDLMVDVMKTFQPGGGGGSGGGSGGRGNGGGGGGGDDKFHELERRLSALETENKSLKTERDTYKGEATSVKLETQLTRAALAAGVESGAVDMVIRLTRDDFELDSKGNAVVKLDPSVKSVAPNAAPVDYFKTIQTDDVFKRFWPASEGGGAGGGRGPAGGLLGAENPFSKAGWNKTKQGQLVRSNPAEADRMMKAAGVTLSSTRPNK